MDSASLFRPNRSSCCLYISLPSSPSNVFLTPPPPHSHLLPSLLSTPSPDSHRHSKRQAASMPAPPQTGPSLPSAAPDTAPVPVPAPAPHHSSFPVASSLVDLLLPMLCGVLLRSHASMRGDLQQWRVRGGRDEWEVLNCWAISISASVTSFEGDHVKQLG